MGRWRVFLFLGLALWAMTVPALAAELPADVETALPRDAGRLLDGVEQWDAGSLTEGIRSIWDHLKSNASNILRSRTRGAGLFCWWCFCAAWWTVSGKAPGIPPVFCLWREPWPSPP